jgi:hypothetical protein
MKLFSSSTFKFSAMVLLVGILAVIYSDMTWLQWFDQAKYYVGIYAGKEGVRYYSEGKDENK